MPCACIVMEFLSKIKINVVTFFAWFGRYSLEIYVLHMLAVKYIKALLVSLGVEGVSLPLLQTVLTLGIVIGVCPFVHRGIDCVIDRIRQK